MVAVEIPGAAGRLRVGRVALGSAFVEGDRSIGIELQEIVALAGQRRCIVVRSIRLVVVSSGGSICRCPSFFGCQQVGFRSGRRGSTGVVFLIAGERKTQGEGQKVKKTGFHVVENK